MERVWFAFRFALEPRPTNKKRHDAIWPELVEAIRGSGQSNDSPFRQCRTIMGYVECDRRRVELEFGKDVDNCSLGELGARAVEIVDAAYRNARSGKLEKVAR